MTNEERVTETTLQDVAVGPLVRVVIASESEPHVFPFSDIAQEGDDPAMISDSELLDRVARWIDRPVSDLGGHIVTRPTTGNLLISPDPKFGS